MLPPSPRMPLVFALNVITFSLQEKSHFLVLLRFLSMQSGRMVVLVLVLLGAGEEAGMRVIGAHFFS